MRLWRVLPWDPQAPNGETGGPLWVPRELQGTGRHDAPEHYGCLYLAEDATSAVAEALAPFRGTGDLGPELLVRAGRQLGLAGLSLDDRAQLIDLDEPSVLAEEALRPSVVATHRRSITQGYALDLFLSHPEAAGLRWWSVVEAGWIQVTVFDRAYAALAVEEVSALSVDDDVVIDAAIHLGLR